MFVFSTRLGANAPGLPALPPPAPLPSLPVAFSRRAAIFAAAATTGALAGSAARALRPSDSSPDSMAALYAEARVLRAAADRATSDAEVDRLGDRLTALERRAATLHVTTPAGAVAALEWVRSDLVREDSTASTFDFHPALIGQALAVLHGIGGAL